MATYSNHTLTLSTGREVYVHGGVVGIAEDMDPAHGWDGRIDVASWVDKELILSAEERAELADYAISLWQRFKSLPDSFFVPTPTDPPPFPSAPIDP